MPNGSEHDSDDHAMLHGIEAIRRELSEIRSALALLPTKTDLETAIQNQLESEYRMLEETLRDARRETRKLEALAKKNP